MTDFADPEAVKNFNLRIVDEFRANGGKVTGPFTQADLLLTTTGAKSGQRRVSPLAYFHIDDKLIVIGSFHGASVNPNGCTTCQLPEPRRRLAEQGADPAAPRRARKHMASTTRRRAPPSRSSTPAHPKQPAAHRDWRCECGKGTSVNIELIGSPTHRSAAQMPVSLTASAKFIPTWNTCGSDSSTAIRRVMKSSGAKNRQPWPRCSQNRPRI